MGLIQDLLKKAREKKKTEKSQPAQDIEDYVQSEKQKQRIDVIKEHERNSFLYGRGNVQDG